jgi:co-chaperonin GroES (HSP10)
MTTNNLKAIGNKLIVKRIEKSDSSKSTIVLIDNSSSDQILGKVLKVGNGSETQGICEGENVWFGKFSGTELYEDIFVVNAEDVLAIEEAIA